MRRHLLLALTQRIDCADRVAQLGGLFEALVAGRLGHPPPQILDELVVAPFEEQPRVAHRRRVAFATQISRTHGAMQRLMSYRGTDAARSPVITSLQDRMPNSRCVSVIVRRASEAGRNGPA